uniref:Peptidylprolyl isomerase n=1 Tax=Noctiluca scintillans TaxID=2966 RepID=A0A7S1F3G4_NOCSC
MARLCTVAFALVAVGQLCSALELTPDNWEKKVKGKTLFVKFYAPWCGHCKKLKPDWDKLMRDFKGSKKALVAEVDCTGDSQTICETHGVTGYPTLMWGRGVNLHVYEGARTYQDMKLFADDHLGASCGPAHLELCDEKRRALMEKFMKVPPEALDARIEIAKNQMKKAEQLFIHVEQEMVNNIRLAEQQRDQQIRSIREGKGLPASSGTLELTPANWDEHVGDKMLFLKFFAPWCGHCKSMKPDWDRLAADYEGTNTALVAEVDCTAAGEPLCTKHDVTGYPRLMWGQAGDLVLYTGARRYDDLLSFAEDHLGESCGPNTLSLCEDTHREAMERFAGMSLEKREAKSKGAKKAIEKAENAFQDAQWNHTLAIDLAEQKKVEQLQTIQDQGLSEAIQVQTWNKKQPPDFWTPPVAPTPPPSPDFLRDALFEVAGVEVSGFAAIVSVGCVLALFLRRPKRAVRTCRPRHILMKEKAAIETAKVRLDAGEDFGTVAAECSACPSGQEGGNLGLRQEGSMNSVLDALCFDSATKLGELVGPIESPFGFHLFMVDERDGVSSTDSEKKTK